MSGPIEMTAAAVVTVALAIAAVIAIPTPRFKPEQPAPQAEPAPSPQAVVDDRGADATDELTEVQRVNSIEQAVAAEKVVQFKLTQQVKALTEEIRKK